MIEVSGKLFRCALIKVKERRVDFGTSSSQESASVPFSSHWLAFMRSQVEQKGKKLLDPRPGVEATGNQTSSSSHGTMKGKDGPRPSDGPASGNGMDSNRYCNLLFV